MDTNREQIEAWAAKMKDGSISDAEQALFNAWLNEQMTKDSYAFDHGFAPDEETLKQRILEKLHARLEPGQEQHIRQPKIKRRTLIRWLSAAAAVLLVVGGTSMYLHYRHQQMEALAALPKGPLNQAILTLPNGKTIALDRKQNGIIISDGDIKYQNGKSLSDVILSEAEGSHKAGETHSTPLRSAQGDALLQLTTPAGGQYQVILSDGTKIWLNVASTLKYPSKFTGEKREVFLTGEAYFEINSKPVIPSAAEGSHKSGDVRVVNPFTVKTPNQTITVLGTSFNLQAYADEPQEKTALISGSVKVTGAGKETLLKPEQQAVLKDGKIKVQEFDPEAMTAWKNGVFRFQGEDIYSVMRQLARWYGLSVRYRGHFSDGLFGGAISRQASLQEALLSLEKLGMVHFEVSGNQITVIGEDK